ncbi:hypothetical protein KXV85_011130, partial [Aspergillus fumigatus]
PTSRGRVRLSSADWREAPIIEGNYLGTDRDLIAIVRAIQAARELGNQTALNGVREAEIVPGPKATNRADLIELARTGAASFGHAVGTAKIGTDRDAVVDSELRVHGVRGLRVADASEMRIIPMSFTIDVHHHILPDVFWRATNDAHSPVGGITPAPWSKESTLSYMDDAGIDIAITSISTPGVHMGDDAKARDLARRVNEISAGLIQERPDRFGGFAALPLPDVDGALKELEYGLDVLQLDGVVLFSNARGIYLGDARFRPLFDELERRKAVVFVHPTASPDSAARASLGLPDSLIDFTADTTRAVAQMHYHNTFARTPS